MVARLATNVARAPRGLNLPPDAGLPLNGALSPEGKNDQSRGERCETEAITCFLPIATPTLHALFYIYIYFTGPRRATLLLIYKSFGIGSISASRPRAATFTQSLGTRQDA